MKVLNRTTAVLALLAVVPGLSVPKTPAAPSDEVKEVRISRQYGLGYLPLIVMEEQHLIEKHAQQAGLGEIKTTWVALTGGAAASDALLSGSVDYIGSGVAPLITLWAKTGGKVRGVASLDTTPVILNTINPAVKTIKDFSNKDRIALPAVKVSIQAVVLQIAAAREFGESNYTKLDPLTVTMKHPDALLALLSGQSELSGHLASPPFIAQELKNPRVRTVLNSFELLEGPHTFDLLSTTDEFRSHNPKTYSAVLAALEEAVSFINQNKRAAAEIYQKSTKSKETIDEILAQLNDPLTTYTTTPLHVTKFSDFLYRVGSIKKQPGWKDLFFPEIHTKPGS